MDEYRTFEISFSDFDLDKYDTRSKKCKKFLLAHIYAGDNEIELRIFYNPDSNFGHKITCWWRFSDSRYFGKQIKTRKEDQNNRLLKIDFSETSFLSYSRSSRYIENGLEYIIIKIDCVKYYWKSYQPELHTAEFYLNDAGFDVVKGFYAPLFDNGDEFVFDRMKGMETFYPFLKAEFRPEFHFYHQDSRDNTQAIITKEPKLQFRYKEAVTEEEAIYYGEVICLLASFFFHRKIDFVLARIHLPEHTITIKKIQANNFFRKTEGLYGFRSSLDFHGLLKSEWQDHVKTNIKKLSRTIDLFNQSHIVDSSSRFLIRYNIIEVCSSGKGRQNSKFKEILKGNIKQKRYQEALKILLKTIDSTDHKDFSEKWKTLVGKLVYKPIKSPLTSFFEEQNLNPAEFPISVNELKELRDNITHGSIDKINNEELENANIFLYRISGILILNLMGIKDWKLVKEIV